MAASIILIGFMGVGKDTVGQAIARRAGLRFLSTDDMIERQQGRTIAEIFAEQGETYFRQLETDVLHAIKDLKNIVLVTGGGIVLNPDHVPILQQMGRVIHLTAPLDVLESRLQAADDRPLIRDRKNIRTLYEHRQGMYDFASQTIDTSLRSPGKIATEILEGHQFVAPELESQDLNVETHQKTYTVEIGTGLISGIGSYLHNLPNIPDKAAIITNPLLACLYLDEVTRSLTRVGIEPLPIIVPDGEAHKTMQTISVIYDELLMSHLSRFDVVLALGGGVIGDLAGFVASTYKRGTGFIQIPTTLLAQVDASVGGKTGFNHRLGKNMIGTFYQPDRVVVDVETLLTLSDAEYCNGLAEVVKAAIIRDGDFFDWLRQKQDDILAREPTIVAELLARSIDIKRRVVEADEEERLGIREILNFGHSIGHAIESLTHYHRFKHGQAVAIGMAAEARISDRLGLLYKSDVDKIRNLLTSLGLPVDLPDDLLRDDLLNHMQHDKKVSAEVIKLPVLETIGTCVVKEIAWSDFSSYMAQI